MHRYTIEIDGRRFVIDVEEKGADRFGVQVDGRSFDVTLAAREELGGDAPLQIVPSATPPATGAARPPAPAPLLQPSATPSAPTASNGVLRAAMPGVILPGGLYFVGPLWGFLLWAPLNFLLLLPQYQPVERDALQQGRALLVGQRPGHVGIDQSRRNAIDRDIATAEFLSQRTGQARHPGLGRRVVGLAGIPRRAHHRSDVDDAAVTSFHHAAHHQLRETEHRL